MFAESRKWSFLKSLVAMLLAIVMVFGLGMPGTGFVFADDGETQEEEEILPQEEAEISIGVLFELVSADLSAGTVDTKTTVTNTSVTEGTVYKDVIATVGGTKIGMFDLGSEPVVINYTFDGLSEEKMEALLGAFVVITYNNEVAATAGFTTNLANYVTFEAEVGEDGEESASSVSVYRASESGAQDGAQTVSVRSGEEARMMLFAAFSAPGTVFILPLKDDVLSATVSSGDCSSAIEDIGGYGRSLVIVKSVATGGGSVEISFSLEYENGITPAGTSQSLTVYSYPAVAGGNVAGSGLGVDLATPVTSNDNYTLAAVVDETVTVAKTSSTASMGAAVTRPYEDVALKRSDDYAITYNIAVATTGNANTTGRLFVDSVKVTDTITFPAGAAPTKITVGGVEATNISWTDTSATFEVDVPLTGGLLSNTNIAVVATFSKDDYTNHYGMNESNALRTITNTATVEYKYSIETASRTTGSSSVDHAFGYEQAAPGLPTLTINKYIKINELEVLYGKAARENYVGSEVKFELSGNGITTVEVTVNDNGVATFPNLAVGTYTLTETQGAGDKFAVMQPATVTVAINQETGLTEITVTPGAGETNPVTQSGNTLSVTNVGSPITDLTVTVQKQTPHVAETSYTTPNAAEIYLSDGTNEIKGVTDNNGKVTFYNVDASKTYTLITKDTGYAVAEDSFTLTAGQTNTKDIKLNCTYGSLVLSKAFADLGGNSITVGDYKATFKLTGTDNSNTYDIVLSSVAGSNGTNSSKIVTQNIAPGTYTLSEVSITANDGTAIPYALGSDATVVITAGVFNTEATGGSASAGGVFTNTTNQGTIKISNLDSTGTPITAAGFKYQILDSTNNIVVDNITLTGGTYTTSLPAGSYTVVQTAKPAGYTLTDSSVSFTVAEGTSLGGTVVVDNAAKKLVMTGVTQQAAFLHMLLPTVTFKKTSALTEASLSGATFVLYKADGANYVKTDHTTTSSNGTHSIFYVEAGEYILVETKTPAGYIVPDYVEKFYDGTALKDSVAKAGISGVVPFTVADSAYANGTAGEVEIGDPIKNVPYAHVQVKNNSQADQDTNYAGAEYTLYAADDTGTPLATATTTTEGFADFIIIGGSDIYGLAPGNYVIKQTEAAEGVLLSEAVVKITVAAGGSISVTNSGDLNGNPLDSVEGGNTLQLTYSAYEKVDVQLQKYGETLAYDSNGNSALAVLQGAEFVVYYEANDGRHYLTFNQDPSTPTYSQYYVTGDTTDESKATKVISGTLGYFTLNNLDQSVSKTYYIEELEEMLVPDSGTLAMYYEKGIWQIDIEDDGTYVVLDGGNEIDPYEHVEGLASSYPLINRLKGYSFELQKDFMVENTEGEFVKADATGSGMNGVFYVYQWQNEWEENDFSTISVSGLVPVNTITTGTSSLKYTNRGSSALLPAGKYLVVEVTAPVGAVPAADSNSYIFEEESGVYTSNDMRVTYTTATGEASGTRPAFTIVLGPNGEEYDSENPKMIANYKITGSGSGCVEYVRLYGVKTGYATDADGNLIFEKAISNVNFDIYIGYKDENGTYHRIASVDAEGTAIPLFQVTSGTAGTDTDTAQGEFITGFTSIKTAFNAALADLGSSTIANKKLAADYTYYFEVVEKGPVPKAYAAVNAAIKAGDYPTSYFEIPYKFEIDDDGTVNVSLAGSSSVSSATTLVSTIEPGKEGSLAATPVAATDTATTLYPLEVPNVAGEGHLRIMKAKLTKTLLEADAISIGYNKGNTDELDEVIFELYRSNSDDLTTAVYDQTVTATDFDDSNQYIKVMPGYYWIKEVGVVDGWSMRGYYYSAIKDGAGVDGATSNDDFEEGAMIGPFKVENNGELEVRVYDYPLGEVQVKNFWNSVASTDTTRTVTYSIQYDDGTGFAPYNINYWDSSKTAATTFDVGGNTAYKLTHLKDGTYRLKATAFDAVTEATYLLNEGTIEFTIKNGQVTALKVDSVTNTGIYASAYAFTRFADNKHVLSNSTSATTRIDIDVNFLPMGAIVINKGSVNELGVKTTTPPATLTEAKFKIEAVSGGAVVGNSLTINGQSVSVTDGVVTWIPSQSGNLQSGSLTITLTAGIYKVTEISTCAGYLVDSTPVYVEVGNKGITYLENAVANGAGSEEANALKTDTTGVAKYFYNSEDKGQLLIIKTNSTGATKLAGAEFKLYKYDAAAQDKLGEEVTVASWTTTPTGEYRAIVPSGEYMVVETKAPTGYSKPSTPFGPVTVAPNTTATASVNSVTIKNASNIGITVTKQAIYPAIELNGTVIASEETVAQANVEFKLFKANDTAAAAIAAGTYTYYSASDWTATTADWQKTNSSGSCTFTGISAGVYRIVEQLPTGMNFLGIYGGYGNVETSPNIIVEEVANSLVVRGTDSASSDAKSSAKWNDSTLTLINPYQGVRIAVVKKDADSGEYLNGAIFDLYDAEPASAARIDYGTVGLSGTNGLLAFKPIYLDTTGAPYDYYVNETQAPTGYLIDPFFQLPLQKVTITADDIAAGYKVVEYVNKKADVPTIEITKQSNLETITTPLADSGFDATYTITPTVTSAVSLYEFTVTDNGPKFFSDTVATTAIADVAGNSPTYTIKSVAIYKSTAIAEAGASAAAVYARVNGGAWQLLTDDTTGTVFDLNGDDQKIVVEYTSKIPATGEKAVVGPSFTPGKIEVAVTIDKFEPSATQAEVQTIKNTATATAYYGGASDNGGNKISDEDSSIITTVLAPVPPMTITKTLSGYPLNPAPKSGSTVEYVIILKNESETASIMNPIIIDEMQANTMHLAEVNGEYDYEVVLSKGTATETLNYSGSNVAIWSFPNYALEPGETIKITFRAELDAVVIGKVINNTAYATSGTALRVSANNPTGASFTPGTLNEGNTGHISGTVNAEEFDRIDGYFSESHGLYVKAKAQEQSLQAGTDFKHLKSISTDGSSWISTKVPVIASKTDTIYYRLMLQNSLTNPVSNVGIYEILPFAGDEYQTAWDADFIDAWLANFENNIEVQIIEGSDPARTLTSSDYKIMFSSATTYAGVKATAADVGAQDAKSFKLTLNDQMPSDSILIVTYSIPLPDWDSYTDAWISSLRKTAGSVFYYDYIYGTLQKNVSNDVYAKLMEYVDLTGTVWNDANRDGVIDTGESGIAGAAVNLYISTNGGTDWTSIKSETTGSDGTYSFKGLESSYGDGAPVYKIEVINPDGTAYRFTTKNEAYNEGVNDTKSHMLAIATDDTKGDSGTLAVYTGGTVNAGLYEYAAYKVTYLNDVSGVTPPQGVTEADIVFPSINSDATTGFNQSHIDRAEGDTYTVTSVVPTWPGSGYSFGGWKLTKNYGTYYTLPEEYNGTTVTKIWSGSDTFTMPDGDVELTAIWIANPDYTVTYENGATADLLAGLPNGVDASDIVFPSINNDGITGFDQSHTGILEDSRYTLTSEVPTWPGSGYSFVGWQVTIDDSNELNRDKNYYGFLADGINEYGYVLEASVVEFFTMPGNNVTLTAMWAENPIYTVTYTPGIAGTGASRMPDPRTYDVPAGRQYDIMNNVPRWLGSGYVFLNWRAIGNSDPNTAASPVVGTYWEYGDSFTMPSGDVVLMAVWEYVEPDPTPTSTPTPEESSDPTPEPAASTVLPEDPDPEARYEVIDDDGVPLGEWYYDSDAEEWIFDDFIPLGSLPQTGDESPLAMYFLILAAAGISLILIIPRKKKHKED